jgi:hypothetical protein
MIILITDFREKKWCCIECIHVAQDENQWRAHVKMVSHKVLGNP